MSGATVSENILDPVTGFLSSSPIFLNRLEICIAFDLNLKEKVENLSNGKLLDLTCQ